VNAVLDSSEASVPHTVLILVDVVLCACVYEVQYSYKYGYEYSKCAQVQARVPVFTHMPY
jgi:hydrogenase maturation factor HypF (carbamoyltransferase family)